MHQSVLLNEVIQSLNISKDKTYVDCTLGLGGHSFEILKNLTIDGKLICLERDLSSLELAKDRLREFNNCYLSHSNFTDLKGVLNSLNLSTITGGVLLDLGINSFQLDNPERGFNFKSENTLDMRMDKNQEKTAYSVINNYKEERLAEVIYKYGEERLSRKIAREIINYRSKSGPIKSSNELSRVILHCFNRNQKFKTHPATRTFQAIRIEVNNELENIKNFLCFIQELLSPGSRLCVISFHSLEDRIIKNFLKNNSDFKTLTKKPIIPSEDEIQENPRSRSAKLRVAERI